MWRFLFGFGKPSLRSELVSIAVWFGLLAAVELLWLHDVGVLGLAFLLAMFVGVSVFKDLYWHLRPSKKGVLPLTRYTSPRDNKEH